MGLDGFKKLLKGYRISIFSVIIVLFLSFANFGDSGYSLFANADKVVHFCMYAAITISLCYDSRGRAQSRGRRKVIVKCFTAAVICGIITELGQEYLTDYRSGDIFDFIVNTAGAATGCLISAIILYYYTKKIDV